MQQLTNRPVGADMNRIRTAPRSRRGAALTELAVCLPLITLLVFGGIETADMVFLKENIKSVSYEGGRAAAKFNSDNDEVLDRMQALLTGRQVADASIALQLPSGSDDVSETKPGDIITVIVSAPAEHNTVGPLNLFRGRTITVTTHVVRE